MTQISNSILPLLMQLIQKGQGAQQEARQANEARRDDIIKGLTGTRDRVLNQWKDYGTSLTADTNQGYDKNLKDSLAALYNSGLGQSTVNASIRNRNETERQNAMRRVKDDITSNTANADERLSNNLDSFKERIVDAYPDSNSLSSIASLLGQLAGSGQLGGMVGGGQPAPPPAMPVPLSVFAGGGRTAPNSLPGNQTYLPAGMKSIGDGRIAPTDPVAAMAAKIASINAARAAAAPPAPAKLPWQMHPSHSGAALDANPAMNKNYEPMPALGIFGSGVQKSDRGSGYGQPTSARQQGGYYVPNQGKMYDDRMKGITNSRAAGVNVMNRGSVNNMMQDAWTQLQQQAAERAQQQQAAQAQIAQQFARMPNMAGYGFGFGY